MAINKGRRWYFSSYLRFARNINMPRISTGAPTNGTTGTGAGTDGPGSLYVDYANGNHYINLGTKASPVWNNISASGGGQASITAITATGAIAVRPSGIYVITKAGVAAMTLAAPTTGAAGTGDDGVRLEIFSNTAYAHTITATGLLNTGSAFVNVATFNARAGASLTLRAYGALWSVVAANGVSFS